jgi:hypothetical protein
VVLACGRTFARGYRLQRPIAQRHRGLTASLSAPTGVRKCPVSGKSDPGRDRQIMAGSHRMTFPEAVNEPLRTSTHWQRPSSTHRQPDLPAESGEARIGGLARLSLHPTVLRNPSTPQTLLSFMLRQKQESQHAQHGEAERRFLAVPGRRLPHEEILSTYNLKPR